MTCCKKCYYRNKNSKYTNENCVFFDQSVEILDWVQLCLRRCFEDVASAQHPYFMRQITDLKISMAEEEVNDVSQVDAFNPFPPSVQRHAVTPV